MKTKLLKKIRNNYRIVVNELDGSKIQKKSIFGYWCDDDILDVCELIHIEIISGKAPKPDLEGLITRIAYKYSNYSRKNKIRNKKKNTWKVIWYNK